MLLASDLRGKLLDATSDSGIPAATIRLLRNDELAGEALTGKLGEFSFRAIPGGRYEVHAEKDGYVDLAALLGARHAVAVAEHQSLTIEVRLFKACSISGHVFDESGRPARNVRVTAVASRLVDGAVRSVPQSTAALSDDRGSYRLYGLAPGRYMVAALPRGEQTGSTPFPATYYPGVVDQRRAESIVLGAGETSEGRDILLPNTPTASISGFVYGTSAGSAGQNVAVTVLSAGGWPIETVFADGQGRFAFLRVPSGAYRVVAWGPIFGRGDKGPVASADVREGAQDLELEATDLDNVQIELKTLPIVRGRVAIDGISSAGEDCRLGAQVSLQPIDFLPASFDFQAHLKTDGFTFANVPFGRFRLRVHGLQPGCYERGVMSGLQDDSGHSGIIDVTGNATVKLMIGTDVGQVSGMVRDIHGRPVSEGTVLLIGPLGEDPPGEQAQTERTDTLARYRFDNVAPGIYELIAARSLDSADYLDSTVWEHYGGVRAAVRAREAVRLDLRLAR